MRFRCWTRRLGVLSPSIRWKSTIIQTPQILSPYQITQSIYDAKNLAIPNSIPTYSTKNNSISTESTSSLNSHSPVTSQNSFDSTDINLTFLHLLHTNSNVSTFSFVAKNITTLHSEFLQIFIYNLITQGNLSAATTLLHLVFSLRPSFKLATELWSLFTVKVCETSDHLGSVLIYHHLIDNHLLYTETNLSYYNHENSHFPFLLTPTLLEQMAIIFQRQGDPMRTKGILRYFKRFYSYLGHKNCYKSLLLSVVEAYSTKGELANALDKFKNLALTFRGHTLQKDWSRLQKLQRTSVFTNHVWRRNNIKQNVPYPDVDSNLKTPVDVEQEGMVPNKIYNPIRERNVYTAPNTVPIPILNGTLRTVDLPCFQTLITGYVLEIMKSKDKDVWNILSFIVSNHFMLHIFVIKSLCDLDYVQEALLLIKKLPTHLRYLHKVMDIKDENFYNIINGCRNRMDNSEVESIENSNKTYEKSSDPRIITKDSKNYTDSINSTTSTLFDTINYYSSLQIENKLPLSPRVFSKFLSCLLLAPLIEFDDLKPHLENFITHRSSSKSCIYLSPEDFEKISGLWNSNQELAKYSSVLKSY